MSKNDLNNKKDCDIYKYNGGKQMTNNKNIQKRKQNMKIYSTYRTISMDLLFIYAIDFLFLTQVKNINASDVVLKTSFYAMFMILLQIPANIIINKLGVRRSVILANIFNTIYLFLIMLATNLKGLIIAEFFSALCFSIKDVSDTTLLNISIPEGEKKSEIFSKIEGKGNKNYYYINSITLILSGILYDVNPYLPIIASIIISILAIILSSGFQEIETTDIKNNKNIGLREQINDLIKSFRIIIKSSRLKSLILYSGIMWGTFCLVSTYRTSLLEEQGISAIWISTIAAIVGIASGIGAKNQLKLHNKLKNKTLSAMAITTAVTILLSGFVGISKLSSNSIMIFITIFYIIINSNKGIFGVITIRYLGNFADSNILPKIYAINNISRNVFRMLIGFLGSYILTITNTANSLILTGIIFTIVTLALISYMKTRTGLKPEEYKKEDIEFDIS